MTIEESKRLYLSPSFTLYEFLYSETALKHGLMDEQLNIPEKYILNLKRLCINVLQPLRQEFRMPIKVNSGYRCEKLNEIVGGSKTSEHLFGMAADIIVPGKMPLAFHFIKNRCNFNQLVNEKNLTWIHVSYNEFNNLKQIKDL